MKKILIVIGTRPEAIKMAPVIKVLSNSNVFTVDVCNTGQHQEMINQVLDIFEIKPKFHLSIMKPNQNLSDITAGILKGLGDIFFLEKYDLVMVHGDTTTCFSASLSAFYQKISLAHVEAGLRTNDIFSPWPEELNRVLVSKIANFHFAPTNAAQKNLQSERIEKENILVTGNTVIDALLYIREKIDRDHGVKSKLDERFKFLNKNKKLILVTGHRRENFGDGFRSICVALKVIAHREDVEILYPVHLNPNVKKPVQEMLGGISNIHLIDPVDYISFVYLMIRSYIIVTDSGGVQEEAPFLGIPVILMREKTERPEAVSIGAVKLVGTNEEKIIDEVTNLINDKSYYEASSKKSMVYGDGMASLRILDYLTARLK